MSETVKKMYKTCGGFVNTVRKCCLSDYLTHDIDHSNNQDDWNGLQKQNKVILCCLSLINFVKQSKNSELYFTSKNYYGRLEM